MARSSTRHTREIFGVDSAGETAEQHGEVSNDEWPGGGPVAHPFSYDFTGDDDTLLDIAEPSFLKANAPNAYIKLSGNKGVFVPGPVAEQAEYSRVTGEADLVLEMDVTHPAGNDKHAGFVARYLDSDNHFAFGVYRSAGTSGLPACYGYHMKSGVWNYFGGTPTIITLNGSGTTKFRLELNGNSFKFYVDEVLVRDLTDTFNQTETRHGLFMQGPAAGSDWSLDDYDQRDLPA